MRVSKTRGSASLVTTNLDLNDFAAFMPEGLAVTGKLNGYARASWAQGSKPKIDARLVTRNGEIGMAAEDPQEVSTAVRYDELSVIAKSISEGLQLRLDVTTQQLVQVMQTWLLILIRPRCQCVVKSLLTGFSSVYLSHLFRMCVHLVVLYHLPEKLVVT